MGLKYAVVGSSLVVVYKEIKLCALLCQVYPQDFVEHTHKIFITKLL